MSESYEYTEDRIEEALDNIADNIFTNVTKAALWYKVEPRTLQRRVKGGVLKSSKALTNLYLLREQEQVLY